MNGLDGASVASMGETPAVALRRDQIEALFSVQTVGYEPPLTLKSIENALGLPPLTLRLVELMKTDYQVKLGMRVKGAAWLKPEFKVTAPRPEVAKFVTEEIESWWTGAMPDVIDGAWNVVSGGEVIYRRDDTGLVRFQRFKPVYPSDVVILDQGGKKAGLRIGSVHLWGPKGFVYVHDRQCGSWEGQSELLGAYKPWNDKVENGGAEDAKKLWFYKCAFFGGGIKCPPGVYRAQDGTETAWLDIARAAIEAIRTGGVWAFENAVDANGNSLWELMRPEINGSASDLFANIDDCDKKITRGMGVPDDIVSQNSGTGSYAGRTIPAMAFYTAEELTLRVFLNEFREQILDWLVWMNFGTRDYSVSAKVNVAALMGGETAPPPSRETARLVDAEVLSA